MAVYTLDRLQDNGQIAFRYIASDVEGPANPNGAARDIAGILSTNGRIMGMMPHPERAVDELLGNQDGVALFESLINLSLA